MAVSSEGGWTLVEMLVATVLGLIVIGAGVTVFTASIGNQPRIDQRAAQIQQARTMSERLTRELRQGSNASSADPAHLMILTYTPHTQGTSCGSTAGVGTSVEIRCRIFYACSTAGSCTRTECSQAVLTPPVGPTTGCGPATTVVTGLMTNSVFTFSPRIPGQAYVAVHLAYAAENGNDAITIDDGVALRNPPLGGP
jgi:Tfp pilus assembly protein PilW